MLWIAAFFEGTDGTNSSRFVPPCEGFEVCKQQHSRPWPYLGEMRVFSRNHSPSAFWCFPSMGRGSRLQVWRRMLGRHFLNVDPAESRLLATEAPFGPLVLQEAANEVVLAS